MAAIGRCVALPLRGIIFLDGPTNVDFGAEFAKVILGGGGRDREGGGSGDGASESGVEGEGESALEGEDAEPIGSSASGAPPPTCLGPLV